MQLSAQNRTAIYRGQITGSLGYGIGNIWVRFLKEGTGGSADYRVRALGPVSLVGEYAFHRRWSGGLSFTYSNLRGSFDRNGFVFDDQLRIITVLARVNVHPGRFRRWDPYFGAGLGYVQSRYTSSVSGTQPKVPGELGYSAQAGARYYLTSHWGLYAEAGYVNGSFFQTGLHVAW